MKEIIFMLLCLPFFAAGQNDPRITGTYGMGSGQPEGGSHLYVLDSHKYVIVYFGGAQVGSWQISRDSVVVFTPAYEPDHFVLYGRHNKDLADSMRIHFLGFSDERTFISTTPGPEPVLQPVFNPDPNCFGYPYVAYWKQSGYISCADLPGKELHRKTYVPIVYTFQHDAAQNDFIAYYHKEEAGNQPFAALLRKEGLLFEGGRLIAKQPLEPGSEDLDFMITLSHTVISPGIIYTNPLYNGYNNDIAADSNYVFDKQKNAYIHKWNYREGEEYKTDADNAYNQMNIIYAFERLNSFTRKQQSFRIAGKPLFFATCK